MQINALEVQLSNLVSSFSENSIRNDITLTVTSIYCEHLPMDVIPEIIKYTDFDTSKNFFSVSKYIRKVIFIQNEERRKSVKGIAFGKEEWLKFYDVDIGNEPLLPRDIIEILNRPDHLDPTRSLRNTHTLTLIPRVSVKSIGELNKKYFPTSTGYGHAYQPVLDQLETPNDKSYWSLMSKEVLNGSRDKNYETQQKMVAVLSKNAKVNCEIPTALEAVVSILTHHVRSGERLFSVNPETSTRCLDVYKCNPVVVGHFAPSGLEFYCNSFANDSSGVAVMRKFRPLVIG